MELTVRGGRSSLSPPSRCGDTRKAVNCDFVFCPFARPVRCSTGAFLTLLAGITTALSGSNAAERKKAKCGQSLMFSRWRHMLDREARSEEGDRG